MRRLRKMLAWAWGIVRRPYPTAETIAADGDPIPGLLLFLLLTAAAMAVHSGALSVIDPGDSWHPLYFLRQMGLDCFGLLLAVSGIYLAVKLSGGEATWRKVLGFWTFSYLPTAVFFGLGYLGLIVLGWFYDYFEQVPQPLQLLGLFFAALMLLWKFWLLLTTLRVVGNLTLPGVIRAGIMIGAGLFFYWWLLWELGWQMVPYL